MAAARIPEPRREAGPRRRSVIAALTALGATTAVAGCSVPEPRRPVPAADPAPGMPIASAGRAQLMQILAHPDDDLYFMNPDTQRMLDAGVPLVSVYITAGEHTGVNRAPGGPKPRPDTEAYTAARHQGLRQTYADLLGLDMFTPWTKGVASLRGDRQAEINTLTSGSRRVELIFLNLPEHTRRHWTALPSLWNDRSLSVRTVPAQGSPLREPVEYDYDGLLDVLVGLMEQYRPTVVQTLDPDPDIQISDERTRRKDSEQPGYSDHGDHTAAACFGWAAMVRWVAEATENGGQVPGFVANAFRGYYNRHWPKNLPPAVLAEKAGHLVPYGGDPDWRCGNSAGCGDYAVGGDRPLTNKKGWVRSTHHRHPGPRPAVFEAPGGRLVAYGVLGLRAVRWRETGAGSGRWGAPDDLGGGPLAPALGSAVLRDGRQLLFGLRIAALGGRGAANRREIVLLEQRTAGGAFLAWTGLGHPESTEDRGRRIGVPVAVTAPDGRVHLFVRDADRRVSTRVREADGSWGPWRALGGEAVQDGLSAVVDAGGLVHVFGSGIGTVRHWAQPAPGADVVFRPEGLGPEPGGPVAALPGREGGVRLYYRTPATAAVTLVGGGGRAGRIGLDGYGPVRAVATRRGPALLSRDPRGRLLLRSGGRTHTRTLGAPALESPALLDSRQGPAAVGLGPDARPWIWRPGARTAAASQAPEI
ncbi:PIG-L family deacetylase [Streptomyces sp. NPDC020141]|uniref:PIG-L family deacetylase n=1 Tax=Streptomyces sp. NPDC020141 TaxID=3365065 RepID=UPI0037B6FCC2